MLYLGHFSFAEEEGTGESAQSDSWHGYFTCVAEADDVEAAVRKFKVLLRRLRDRDDMFDGVQRIYLDSCIEIHSIPAAGFLAHLSLREGKDIGDISTSIRGATEEQAVAFHLESDEENEDGEPQESEPFIVFKHIRRRDHRPR